MASPSDFAVESFTAFFTNHSKKKPSNQTATDYYQLHKHDSNQDKAKQPVLSNLGPELACFTNCTFNNLLAVYIYKRWPLLPPNALSPRRYLFCRTLII